MTDQKQAGYDLTKLDYKIILVFIAFYGIIRLLVFYNFYGLNIFAFIGISEVLKSTIPPLYFLISVSLTIGALYLATSLLAFWRRSEATRTKNKRGVIENTDNDHEIDIEKTAYVWQILLLSAPVLVFAMAYISFQATWSETARTEFKYRHNGTTTGNLSGYISIIASLVMSAQILILWFDFARERKRLIGLLKPIMQLFWSSIPLICYLVLCISLAQFEAKLSYDNEHEAVFFKNGSTVVSIDANNLWIGTTDGYYFFHNKKHCQTTVIEKSQVDSISFKP